MDVAMKQQAGMKKTELGWIPVDWEVVRLDDVVTFLDGQRKPIKSSDREKMSGRYRYYGASGVIDYVNDFLFDEELILLGEDGENILSRNSRLAFKVSGKIWVNNHAHVLKPKNNFDIDYLCNYLESLDYRSKNTGTAQPKLTINTCKKIKVASPPLQEQQAIARALSDVDALIAHTDQLLDKKRQIKQGMMQALLTGKKRVKGFEGNGGYKQTELGLMPEDWKVVELNETTNKIGSGITPRGGSSVYKLEGIPFVRSQNIGWGHLLLNDIVYIEENTHKTFLGTEIREGDILMNITGASIGRVSLVNNKITGGNVNQHVCIIRPNSTLLLSLYLKQILLSKIGQDQINSFQAGGNREGLNFAQIGSFNIPTPPTLQEQQAIAQILSDQDTEIQALEAKRDKYQQLKQGMMQELLTGKTRLI